MAKLMVFQHVPYEPLGMLDPLLRAQKHRIRYVNFSRNPDLCPCLDEYDGLIVLGGPMNVTDMNNHPYLATEIKLIEHALKMGIPVLGICLGSQLLAHCLGAKVYYAPEREIGWYSLKPTLAGQQDPLTQHFQETERIFQWHGQMFDIPESAEHLILGESCNNQAYRYEQNAYGFQFHLEVTQPLIERWLSLPEYQKELNQSAPDQHMQQIRSDTQSHIDRSVELGHLVFNAFVNLLPKGPCPGLVLPTRE